MPMPQNGELRSPHRWTLGQVTSVINPALDKYFPASSGVQIIAEPGRYYVASAFTLAVNIIAKKVMLDEQTGSDDEDDASKKTLMYYVNDGIHGSFNLISRFKWEMRIVRKKKSKSDEKFYSSSIWGPTCDGKDCIIEQCDLPELQEGDWILFKNMGAYTVVCSSAFNGFQQPTLSYVMSRAHWKLMHTIQEHGTVPEVPELNDVHVSCVTKNRIELNSIACVM
ncbi:hypothetical protein AB205_0035130 [Aquarana catesbeiana]|uniref:ornithine decarboxylase n=1 Tax=Aquarana catesbeiana TaxID=8400 RepID=A0A2G9QGC0_AQUCT|nr:hypothetical protein AB205_0035130 [Aquarana catesbeiana]PIO14669.1 hypothetical protein AB205_0035130 [Aquarana catesbeiana]